MSSTADEYVYDLDDFTFLVVLGGFVCFAMAWGIGANDVANAFATSVGARAITLKQATVIAAIFEFAGAFLLGSSVTNTIRKGITNYDDFEDEPEILILGMFCALCCSSAWLYLATRFSMPVSTTQSIVGSILGFALVAHGTNAVNWQGVYYIIGFWVASPLGSAIFAIILFVPTRNFILRRDDSYQVMLKVWPLYVWIVIFIMTLFLLFKGFKKFSLDIEVGDSLWISAVTGLVIALIAWLICVKSGRLEAWVQEKIKADEKWASQREEIYRRFSLQTTGAKTVATNSSAATAGDAAASSEAKPSAPTAGAAADGKQPQTGATPAAAGAVTDKMKDEMTNRVAAVEEEEDGADQTNYVLMTENGDKENAPKPVSNTIKGEDLEPATPTHAAESDNKVADGTQSRLQKMITKSKTQMTKGVNVDVHDDLEKYELEIEVNSEHFDPRTERSFNWLQVVSASLDIFAHGSNDVANAVAPFAAMIEIVNAGSVTESVEIPWWVSFLGASGMVIGLATYGYKIIKAIGVRLVSMSSSRGYCIELASALMVITGSNYGFPTSTTHCQIGATVGIGALEVTRSGSKLQARTVVNWKLLAIVFLGWIFTVVISALTCGMLFALMAFSPSMNCIEKD